MRFLYAYAVLCAAFLVLVITFRWTERLAEADEGAGGFWPGYRALMLKVPQYLWGTLGTLLSAGLFYAALPPLTTILGLALALVPVHFGGNMFYWPRDEWRRPGKIIWHFALIAVGSAIWLLHLVHPEMGLLGSNLGIRFTS